MRKSKFTEKQIVEILREIEDGAPVVETLRAKGVSRDTYYKWKQKYSGMQQADLKKLRELERENAKLKKMYAEMALANEALKDAIERPLNIPCQVNSDRDRSEFCVN